MNENQKSPKDTARTEVSLWGIAGLLLRKIHWLIVAGLVLGVGVYLVLSLLVTPTYESRVTFYVYNNSDGTSSSGSIDKSDLQAAESLATTYSKILESNSVLNAVLGDLNSPLERKELAQMVDVAVVTNTQLLEVVITSTDANFACKVAESFASVAGHVAIADDLQALYARYGISLTVTAQDMDTFLASRAAGGYSVTRCSFSADIDDPMPFLSLWASGAGSNCVALGRGAHADYAGYSVTLDGRTKDNCTWAESYDALLYRIQSSGDTAERYSLMHQAETLLMQTGAVCPLYWYTDTYLCNTHVQGLLAGPLGAQYLMGAHVEK